MQFTEIIYHRKRKNQGGLPTCKRSAVKDNTILTPGLSSIALCEGGSEKTSSGFIALRRGKEENLRFWVKLCLTAQWSEAFRLRPTGYAATSAASFAIFFGKKNGGACLVGEKLGNNCFSFTAENISSFICYHHPEMADLSKELLFKINGKECHCTPEFPEDSPDYTMKVQFKLSWFIKSFDQKQGLLQKVQILQQPLTLIFSSYLYSRVTSEIAAASVPVIL